MKKIIIQPNQIDKACQWFRHWVAEGTKAGRPVLAKLSHESRTEAQNRHQWALYNCFVKSGIDWPRGSGYHPTQEEWKILFVSAYNNESSKMTIGLAGEVVNFSYSSSALKKIQFCELIEFIYAEGCERGVKWDDPAMKVYEEWSKQ